VASRETCGLLLLAFSWMLAGLHDCKSWIGIDCQKEAAKWRFLFFSDGSIIAPRKSWEALTWVKTSNNSSITFHSHQLIYELALLPLTGRSRSNTH
jgi:hypothetical protein